MTILSFIVDEAERRESGSGSGGTSWISVVKNVHVNGTPDRDKAISEARWVAERDADGELNQTAVVGVQGPEEGLDNSTWLISVRIESTRYW